MSGSRIERFQALVAAEPENPLHAFALAQAYLGAGDHEGGQQAFGRCLELDPSWMMAAIRRGRCLLELERWSEARQALEAGARLAAEQHHEEPLEEIRELMDRLPLD